MNKNRNFIKTNYTMPVKEKSKGLSDRELIEKYEAPKPKNFDKGLKKMLESPNPSQDTYQSEKKRERQTT